MQKENKNTIRLLVAQNKKKTSVPISDFVFFKTLTKRVLKCLSEISYSYLVISNNEKIYDLQQKKLIYDQILSMVSRQSN
jgi:hypothetical protein